MLQWLCCKYMFQIFHLVEAYVDLSVVKVDLDVGLLSEEERASAGAMATSMWIGRASPVWKRRGNHPSGMEETDTKQCERGGRGAGVKEMERVI